jgi:hypothetical protein
MVESLFRNPASGPLFVTSAFLMQALLILNFAVRNWRPELKRRFGHLVYVAGMSAAFVGVVFIVWGEPWFIVAAPMITSLWGVFGFWVDRVARIRWRIPRLNSILVPYLFLFMVSQFSFWIPLWYVGSRYWIAYSITYAVNTGLNLYSHRGTKRRTTRIGRKSG